MPITTIYPINEITDDSIPNSPPVIAKDFDAKIHIINTYQIPYSTAAPATHQLLNALKIDASEELSKYINTIKSDSNYKNLTITHEAISGDLINPDGANN